MSDVSSSASGSKRHEPEGGGQAPVERVVPGSAAAGVSQLYKPLSVRSGSPTTPRLDAITPGSLLDSSSAAATLTHRSRDADGVDNANILITGHAVPLDDSRADQSLAESGCNSSASCLDSTAQMLAAATGPDGRVDYEALKALRLHERQRYKLKLERERTRRYALEMLIMNSSVLQEADADSTITSSKASTTSTTSDTSGLLLDVIRSHLKKQHKRRSRHGGRGDAKQDGQSSTPTPLTAANRGADLPARQTGDGRRDSRAQSSSQPPAKSMAENYYESTSLFSVNVEEKPRDSSKENRYANTEPPAQTQPAAAKSSQPDKQPSRRVPPSMKQVFSRDTSRQGWWWVGVDGVPNQRMPQLSCQSSQRAQTAHNAFVSRSHARLQAIEAASRQRHALARLHREMAQRVATGELQLEDALLLYEQPEYTLRAPRAFTKAEMELATRRRVTQLPEHRARVQQDQRAHERAINRACADMYKQKLEYHKRALHNRNHR